MVKNNTYNQGDINMSLANKFGIPQGLLDASKAALDEANEYQKKVQAHMAKKGIKSMSDLTADQKKKFFNELDAMHTAKHEEVEPVEEAESHQAKTTMKHIIKPTAGEKKAAKDIKPGIAGYRDRVAMLKSAEARGALKKEEVELTQEDLDFIASLNQIDELRNVTQDQLGGRMSSTTGLLQKTSAGKEREVKRRQEHLKGQMKFTKSQGGIAGPKGKLPEEVELEEEQFDLEDFTLDQIEEFMQTEEFSQLDELSKNTLASYIKRRSHDVATMGAVTRKHAMDSEAAKKDQNYSQARKSDDKANRSFMKGWKHRVNIGKAVDRLTKG